MTTIHKEYMYPLWLRIWHIVNGIMFLFLILTGISLQYAGENAILVSYENAIKIHNICGVILALNYAFFVIVNFISGNFRQYLPPIKGLIGNSIKQARYYLWGMFNGEPKPFPTSKEMKFNPLQQIAYFKVMYFILPLSIISGLGLLLPEILIDEFLGESGLFYTAIVHTIVGFFLSLFMLGHIYLGTTGRTMSANFKAILTGYEEHEKED